MANTVFILGAGASKQAGVPLMLDFLDVASDLLWLGRVEAAKLSFERVFQEISKLQLVHSKSQLDLQNVESVFAAFEMAQTLQTLSDYGPADIAELSLSMKAIIVNTIEQTMLLPNTGGIHFPEPYGEFVDLLVNLRDEIKPSQTVSVITFNYDLGLDYTLVLKGHSIWYGLDQIQPPSSFPVFKLHGSMNWAFCSDCGKAIPWNLEYRNANMTITPDSKSIILNTGSRISRFQGHPEHKLDQYPLIVPPTWNKSAYYRDLSPVWSSAAKHLRDADNIFVIGYSLPMSDAFFRYMYALSTAGPQPLRRFWVFNPDNSEKTKNRFLDLLGPGASQRFSYIPETFENAIKIIGHEFNR